MVEGYKEEIEEEMEAISNEPMVSWEDHDDDKVMTFGENDPDTCVNVWSYNQDTKTYQVDKSHLNPLWNHKKGPVWAGTKFDGFTGKDGGAPPIALNVYKDTIHTHLIKNGMWYVFNYVEPKSKSSISLLDNAEQFTLTEIQDHTIIQCTIADQYAIQNLDWKGQYLLNSINISIYCEVLMKVPVNATEPEVLFAIILCVGMYTYDTMEKLKSKLKKIKLSNYPKENVQIMNVDNKAQCDILHSSGY
eukprot:7970788-Ditylum_brightwellii.AAC.2